MYQTNRMYNVYLQTAVEKIFLGNVLACDPQDAKLKIVQRQPPDLLSAQEKDVKYSLIVNLSEHLPITK